MALSTVARGRLAPVWRAFGGFPRAWPAGGNLPPRAAPTSRLWRCVWPARGMPKKFRRGGNFFLHGGAAGPISRFDPARKKAGQSGVGLTPSVAFFIKARPEVRKAKA